MAAFRSEWQVVVLVLQGSRKLLEVVRTSRTGGCAGLGLVTGRTRRTGIPRVAAPRRPEHDQLPNVDLCRVLGLAILVLPLPVFDPALDEQLVPLLHVLLDDVGQLGVLAVPDDAAMPLRLLLLVATRVVPRTTGGEGEIGDSVTTCRRPYFRVAPQIPDQRHFV